MSPEDKSVEHAIAKLTYRIEALERQLAQATPTIDEHEDRLDDHERQLTAILDDVREVKRNVATLAHDVNRLANASTTQGLTLEKVLANTRRLLEVFESTVVVDGGSHG